MSDPAATLTCARCDKSLTADDRVEASGKVFCRSCYETLKAELRQAVERMSTGVNYPMATVGAILGGVIGILLWWAFTVITKISFGLVAVAIGFLVGHGAVRLAGGKRTAGLQALSIVVAVASFVVATYLVNMTFINQHLAQRGETWRLAFPPSNLTLFYRVLSATFGVMDVVFLAIVVWEAWRIPRPITLPAGTA